MNITSVDASEINLGFLSDRVVQLSKAQRGTIFVIDDVTRELFFVIDTPAGKVEMRMPLTANSMAGAAILNNELINIPDCYQDDRFDPTMDKRTGFKTMQMLCVPVAASDGEPIGAIQIINTENGMAFTAADVEILRNFRVYVQIAILNKKASTAAEHAMQLAKQAISVTTNMSWTQAPEDSAPARPLSCLSLTMRSSPSPNLRLTDGQGGALKGARLIPGLEPKPTRNP